MATVAADQSSRGLFQEKNPNHHFPRYRQIAGVLVKYKLRELVRSLGLDRFLPLHWVPPGIPWRKQAYSKPERTRMALEELGTTFVKLGQILSTRRDLLPPDFIRELAKLQSSVRPIPVESVKEVILHELGRPAEEIFASFDDLPVGVASIGQAHTAVLPNGAEVVVKVRKPGVIEQVKEDIDILRELAVTAAERWEDSQHYDLVGIVDEVAETLTGEMDYLKEARNADYFARFFEGNSGVHIPRVYFEHTTSQVITMERIRGIGILDLPALDKAGFNHEDLAKRSVDLWLKMVFGGSMFHADPHPGNLFVEPDGRLGLVDFGMVGVVDDEVRNHLALAVKAILERDSELLVDSIIELGAMRNDGSRQSLRADLRHLMGHYPKLSGHEFEDNSNLGELLLIVRRNHIQLPSHTFLLLKTLMMAQSLGKELDPGFDILPLLSSNVKQVLKEKKSPLAIFRRLPSAALDLANMGINLPQRLNRLVRSAERGELKIKTDVSGLEVHMEHLERIANRIVLGVLAAAIFLGITILYLAFRLGS